jgi:hypothetical protein
MRTLEDAAEKGLLSPDTAAHAQQEASQHLRARARTMPHEPA